VSVSVCCTMGFMPEIKIYIHTKVDRPITRLAWAALVSEPVG